MSICFVSNKHFTIALSATARRLAARGERIVWLSPSKRWARWLEREGWNPESILDVSDFGHEWRDPPPVEQSREALGDLETAPYPTIANVVRMCRSLRDQPPARALAYLAACRRRVEPFLRAHAVEIVFGEATWGFEMLVWLTSRRLGIPMLCPSTTRIPGDRFFFPDALHSALVPFRESSDDDRAWADGYLDVWRNRPVQPAYATLNRRGYRMFHRRWLEEIGIGLFRSELDRGDETLWSLRDRVADRIRRAWNAWRYRVARPWTGTPAGERYVLYCLHHQPEAAVDVFGSLHSDQVALIDRLSRILPATHTLWVKEHPAAIGDRSIPWYRAIARRSNVRLVDPFAPIYAFVQGADAVVTISGTVGYEAALLGKPVFGLAPLYFAELFAAPTRHDIDPLAWNLHAALRDDGAKVPARSQLVDFLARLKANSFPGDPARIAWTEDDRRSTDYMRMEADGYMTVILGMRRERLDNPGTAPE